MKREEWYNSNKFKTLRLANNIANEVVQKTQQLSDVLSILNDDQNLFGTLSDKFTIVRQQLKILNLEARSFSSKFGQLEAKLSPNQFDES